MQDDCDQLNFNNNQLKVIEGKGRKDRYVPITSNITHKIKLYLNGRIRGYLFTKRDLTQIGVRGLQKRITKRIKEANFNKKLSTHSLRHTFACLCLSRGLRIEDIKLLMGHSSITTTQIYAKLELAAIKEQFLQLMDQRG